VRPVSFDDRIVALQDALNNYQMEVSARGLTESALAQLCAAAHSVVEEHHRRVGRLYGADRDFSGDPPTGE
jgi:hypothetical protein